MPASSLADAPQGHPLGKVVGGQYAILGFLGRGGMGTVYWGIQHPVGRRAAIKVLRSDLTAGSAAEQRFLREAKAVASLHHPNLVTCFHYGLEPDKLAYMALEYLDGATLDRFIHAYQPTLPEIVHVARQLLEGIAAFHDASIVHRDLKPGNVMLCRVGEDEAFVKVIDFGLARLTEGHLAKTLTLQGDVFGTPLYMSPEQCVGTHDVGAASDVYAFGVILYEMLTGRTPFSGDKPMAIMMEHMHTPIPPLRARRGLGEVPPGLVDFTLRCLEKEPTARFAHGGQALQAFDQLELPSSGPITARAADGSINPRAAALRAAAQPSTVPPEGVVRLELPRGVRLLSTTTMLGAPEPTWQAKVKATWARLQAAGAALWADPGRRRVVVAAPLAVVVLLGLGALLASALTSAPASVESGQEERGRPPLEQARRQVEFARQRAVVGSAHFTAEGDVDRMLLRQHIESRSKAAPPAPPQRDRDRAAALDDR